MAWLDQGVEGIGEFARYSEATHACEQLSYRGCQGVVHRRYADGTERYVPALSAGGPTIFNEVVGDSNEDPCAYNGGETADGVACIQPVQCPFGSPCTSLDAEAAQPATTYEAITYFRPPLHTLWRPQALAPAAVAAATAVAARRAAEPAAPAAALAAAANAANLEVAGPWRPKSSQPVPGDEHDRSSND